MKSQWIKVIHTAKNKTGIDDEAYRAILSGQGLSSSTEIKSVEQFNEIMQGFRNMGFVYDPKKSKSYGGKHKLTTPEAPGMITQRQEYYIRGLWTLASRVKDKKSLRAMIKRIGGCDDISWLKRRSASSVILALRDICVKAGLNPDGQQEFKK
ncbi:MAG: regulatory protein GemA [Spirochaetaceae bacterium]|jgi:hypothetical protein|nr:regulatory protein GemA [Spirochaetaceae bacterium]